MTNTMHPLTAKQTIINLAADATDARATLETAAKADRLVAEAVQVIGFAAALGLLTSEIKSWSKRRARWAKAARKAA
jgi:hypothetical protein